MPRRAIYGVTSFETLEMAPDEIPTALESFVRGLVHLTWVGIAPPGEEPAP
ncbi:hypothetical protein [Sorangium sp. So ce1182]|uniref:hypothetical protein n=1 Tax=Sorangium sp. So ce1182 TaxID=3133334 RepID=UPI003F639504